MAEAHAPAHDGEHDDDYAVHTHITSIRTYLIVFGALLFLTGLTVAAYNVRLGELNLAVAVLIAMIKSSLVGAYFMHLKYESKFNTLFFVGSLVFVGVFLGYTLNDTDHRGEETVQGMRVDPATGNFAYGTATVLSEQGEFTPFPEAGSDEAPQTQPSPGEQDSGDEASDAPDEVEGTIDGDSPRVPAGVTGSTGEQGIEPGAIPGEQTEGAIREDAEEEAAAAPPAAE